MSHIKIVLAAVICLSLLWGCSSKNGSTIVLLPDSDGTVGKVEVKNKLGSVLIKNKYEAASVNMGEKPEVKGVMTKNDIQDIFKDALTPEPKAPSKFILYFNVDAHKIMKKSEPIIPFIVTDIKKRAAPLISIWGFTDRTGRAVSNLELSRKRAIHVAETLEQNGISPDIIEITAHGENLPFAQQEDESPKHLNRRVEVFVR